MPANPVTEARLELNAVDNASATIKRVQGAAENLSSSYEKLKGVVASLAGGFGVGYFLSVMKGSIDAADRLNDLSKSTGIAVDQLAGLKLLAKQTGTDLDGLAKGINRMSVELGKDPEKFRALGITAKDNTEAFKQLADLFNLLPDIQQRNALAQKIFAKSWAEMAPALSEGGAKIGEIIEKGAKLSAITPELTKQADDFNDKLAELTGTGAGLTKIIGPLLPMLNVLADDLIRVRDSTTSTTSSMSPLLEILKVVLVVGSDVSFVFTQIGKDLARMVENVRLIAKGDFAGSNALGDLFRKEGAAARKELDEWQAKIMGVGTVGPSVTPPPTRDPAAAAAAAARAAAFLAEEKQVEDMQKAWDSMGKSVAEHSAILQAELEIQVPLTEAQKVAMKAMVALRDGTLQATQAAVRQRAVEIEAMLVRDRDLQIRKQVQAAVDRELQQGEAAQQEYDRRRQVVADFNSTHAQTLQDIEFETKLLGIKSQLNGAGLMLKADEIQLNTQINAQRETLIALRRIDADELRATAALGDMATRAELENLKTLYEARRAAIPDLLLARENARAANEISRNSVDLFKTMWSSVEGTGKSVFEYLLGAGTSTMQSIGKAIKASIIDLLYQLTARKWIIQIGTSVAGALGIGSTANAASGGLSIASGANSLSSLFSGGGTLGAVGAGYSGVAGSVAAEGAMYAAAGTVAEGVGAGLMAGLSAMGPLGWAALGVGALFGAKSLFGGGGGPKPSELHVTQDAKGLLGLSPINVNGAGNADAHNPAYDQAATFLNSLPANTRAALVGKGVTTGATDSAQAMIAALFDSQKDIIASGMEAAKAEAMLAEQAKNAAEALAEMQSAIASAIDDQINAVKSAENAARQTAATFRQISTSLQETSNTLKLGNLSPLSPSDQLSLSRSSLNSVFSAALGGDPAALQRLPTAATEFLTASRAYFASSTAYAQDFLTVTTMLEQAQQVSNLVVDVQEQIAAIQNHQLDVLGAIKLEVSKPHPDPDVLTALNAQLTTGQQQADLLQGTLNIQLSNVRATFDTALALNTAILNATAGATIASLGSSTEAIVLQHKLASVATQAALGIASADTIAALFANTSATTDGANALTSATANGANAVSSTFVTGSNSIIGSLGLTSDSLAAALGLSTKSTVGALGEGKDASVNALAASRDATVGAIGSSASALASAIETTNAAIAASVTATGVSANSQAETLAQSMAQGTARIAGLLQRLIDIAAISAEQGKLDNMLNAQVTMIDSVKAGIAGINALVSQYGVQQLTVSESQAQQLYVDAAGRLQNQSEYQVLGGNAAGWEPFKAEFWKPGGVYDQTYGKAAALAAMADSIEMQRALITGLPRHATGGLASGLSMVGEEGPELVDFHSPGRVYTASQTRGMLSGSDPELKQAINGLGRQMAELTIALETASKDQVAAVSTEIGSLTREVKGMRSEVRRLEPAK